MKTLINYNSITLLFILPIMIICSAATGLAVESSNREITSNINLRQSPDLNGKIITGIKKGTKVIVTGQKGKWYQIAVKKESYGYLGWVFGKYLKKLPDEAKALESAEYESTAADFLTLKDKKQVENSAISENEFSYQERPVTADKKTNMVLAADINTGGKTESLPQLEQEHDHILSVPDDEAEAAGQNLFSNYDVKDKSDLLYKTKADQVPVINMPTEKTKDNVDSASADHTNGFQVLLAIMRPLVKFLSLLFSCIAVLFSYRALKLARDCRNMVMLIQNDHDDIT